MQTAIYIKRKTIMQKNALQSLPVTWQNWVVENLANGCDPEGMIAQMELSGSFGRELSELAIVDAHMKIHPESFIMPKLPEIDASANRIVLPDRTVNVLLSVAMPRIVVLGNVLSDEECDAIASMSKDKFIHSTTIDNDSGVSRLDAGRTSDSADIHRGETDLIARIDARLSALSGWPVDHGEPLQLQKYQVGNEYQAHFDWFDPEVPGSTKHLEKSGQRLATIILYLTDVDEGGGTSFPALGLDVHPQKGSALFFSNTTPYGLPDKKNLHAGLPVVKGVKIVANKWLREKPF
jgi:prolyl 4-hydroxylase